MAVPGTDFARRHLQDERPYTGLALVVKAHNHHECPRPEPNAYVARLPGRIEPAPLRNLRPAGTQTEGSA
jgi:hypothetical protein